MGIWNIIQTVSRGLEQVIKLGEEDSHSHSEIKTPSFSHTNNFDSSGIKKDSTGISCESRRNLKRPFATSEVDSFQPVKKRHKSEDNYTRLKSNWERQKLVSLRGRKLTFLETIRRKRALKVYIDKKTKLKVDNQKKSLPNNDSEVALEELVSSTSESQSVIQSNFRLEILKKKEKLSLENEINMLKQRIQQLKQQENKKVGLLAVYDDSNWLLEQKLLLSTAKFLNKALFHEEASQTNEVYERSEEGLLQLRSKSAIHKSRAFFFAEQVRKSLESSNKPEVVIATKEPLKSLERYAEKSTETYSSVIELSDSSDEDDMSEISNEREEEEDGFELLDELLVSGTDDNPFLNFSEDRMSPEEVNKYLSKGFDLPYADEEANPLSTLSNKALSYCLHVLKEPRNRVLVCKDGMKITRNDLRLLLPGNWLNDEVINFYMSLLRERNERGVIDDKYPKCLFFSSFFFCKLLSKGHYEHAAVQRWTRHINVFDFEKIFIPINIKNCHWILAVIDIKRKRLMCFDSIGGSHMEKLKALEQWLRDEYYSKFGSELETKSYSLEQPNVPRQSNIDDCGVFCCQFAHYISSNWEISFSSKDMRYFRWRMMLEILCQRVS